MKKLSLLLFFLAVTLVSSQSFAQDADYFVGQWDVTVKDTPNGTVNVRLSLERVDGKLMGKFVDAASGRETSITQINEQEKTITLYFFAEGYDLYLTLNQAGEDSLSGSLADSFSVTGQRVKS
jgi:hypothetical protein